MHSIPLRSAVAAIVASLMFALMGTMIRIASAGMPHEMLVFFRNFFGFIILIPWLTHAGISAAKTSCLPLHIVRAVAGLTAMYCFFFALVRLPLAEAVLLNFTAPLFIPFIALFWVGESLSFRVLSAATTGFIGVLFILKPGADVFSSAALIGFASGFFAAVAMVGVRRMSKTEPTPRIVLYFSTVAMLISAIPLSWSWTMPTMPAVLAMVMAGTFATLGQLLLTYSYGRAPAAQIGPYTYTSVVFAAIIGLIYWGEVLDRYTLFGAVLVCCAGGLAMRASPRNKGVPAT